MRASIAELKSHGWVQAEDVTKRSWYPSAGEIVLVNGKDAVCHVYSMYDDSSEYPTPFQEVEWQIGRIVETTIRKFAPL